MKRIAIFFLLLLASLAGTAAQLAASWTVNGDVLLAALEGDKMRVALVTPAGVEELVVMPVEGITALAAGTWNGKSALLGSRNQTLLRFDPAARAWVPLGNLPGTIRQMLPAPGQPAAVILTGGAGNAPENGAVWWATWEKAFTCARITAVKEDYRPWQIWWSAKDEEARLAVATYKSTRFAPFEHNCMFLFTWKGEIAEPCWLGSRLTRPYLEAAHADLRGDGQWRMAAVEVTKNGGRGLSVYAPIQFGYANEWKTEAIPGLQRIAAYGDVILCWGRDAEGNPVAWHLRPQGAEYALIPFPAFPFPEALARIDATRLGGWWDGAWHVITTE